MKAREGVVLLINNCTKKLICGLRNKRVSKTERKNDFASFISLRLYAFYFLSFDWENEKLLYIWKYKIEASTHMHTFILFPTHRGIAVEKRTNVLSLYMIHLFLCS